MAGVIGCLYACVLACVCLLVCACLCVLACVCLPVRACLWVLACACFCAFVPGCLCACVAVCLCLWLHVSNCGVFECSPRVDSSRGSSLQSPWRGTSRSGHLPPHAWLCCPARVHLCWVPAACRTLRRRRSAVSSISLRQDLSSSPAGGSGTLLTTASVYNRLSTRYSGAEGATCGVVYGVGLRDQRPSSGVHLCVCVDVGV